MLIQKEEEERRLGEEELLKEMEEGVHRAMIARQESDKVSESGGSEEASEDEADAEDEQHHEHYPETKDEVTT